MNLLRFFDQIRQKTGIGKTVNSVAKLEGDVGEEAKKLVKKWKEMVAIDEKNAMKPPPTPALLSKSYKSFGNFTLT